MAPHNLEIISQIFAEQFAGFVFHKGRKTWVLKTNDNVLLLVALQTSRMGPLFYLNFGAYFEGIDKSADKCPKLTDWHLTARYEAFHQMSVSEYNNLFSLSDSDLSSLEKRCSEILSYIKKIILPGLLVFGDYKLLCEGLATHGVSVFEPYWAQNIKKDEIAAHVTKSLTKGVA